jgi:hypothetical protein
VPVEDLRVKNGDLVVATHGRSIWILDDLTSVREMTPAIAGQALHAFAPRPAARWQYREEFHDKGPGQNPIHGASIDFWVKNKPKGEVTLEIRDVRGAKVRTLSSKKREPDYAEDDPDAPTKSRRPS